jgi:hypothetical protein
VGQWPSQDGRHASIQWLRPRSIHNVSSVQTSAMAITIKTYSQQLLCNKQHPQTNKHLTCNKTPDKNQTTNKQTNNKPNKHTQ